MSGLTAYEVAQYKQRGYVIPGYCLPEAETNAIRTAIDNLIAQNPNTRPEHLVNAHIAHQNAEGVQGVEELLALAKHPDILDCVESVLGPDIILWGCQVFCKPGGDGMEVPMHQDGHYWPIRPLATCTVWLAVDGSDKENGCLRVIPGSHQKQTLFPHYTDDRENLTLTQAVEEQQLDVEADDVELQAGQMSLHDVYLIHGSNRNTSARRRAGVAFRYMPATSHFHRDLIEPSDASGFKVDFSQRPLWLLRGEDKTGQNDFRVGHHGTT